MGERLTRYVENIDWEQLAAISGRILLVLLLLWAAQRFAGLLLNRLEHRLIHADDHAGAVPGEAEKRANTVVKLLRQAVVIVVWVTGLLIVLSQIGVQIGPLLASAGVAGIALGFGAQNLVRDFIAGFYLILENQVRVGDVAIVNGTGGLVEAVNFRTIVLRDLSGVVHVFPNGTVTTLANMTRGWSAYVFDIGVAYKEDVDEVIAVIKEVGAEMRQDETFAPLIIEDMEVFGVDNFGDSAVVIKGRIKTLPIKQWDVGREFRRRLKYVFDARGIEIPFPHRSIYFGEASKPFLAALAEREAGDKRG